MREEAARELGESRDPRAVRHLIARLGDATLGVSVAAVRSLRRIGDPAAMMPLYELVQNETANPWARRAAAEALERFGLLRRERTGPSMVFLWLLGMALVVIAVAASSILGGLAAVAFVVGIGALAVYAFHELVKRRGFEDVWLGPHGEQLHVPEPADPAGGWLDAFADGPADAGPGP